MRSSFSHTSGVATAAFAARASARGWARLAGAWVVLALLRVGLALYAPGRTDELAIGVFGVAAALRLLWLSGFRVRIKDGVLEYRDGWYQTQRCLLSEIRWVNARMNVSLSGGRNLEINPKPFSRAAQAQMRELLHPQEQAEGKWEQ